ALRPARDLWSWAQLAANSQENRAPSAPGLRLWSWAQLAECAENAEKCNF
ncbi:hypothetical protein A2U01_0080685, partial [Trifolium medium]|nr:hypothetical protein [Trifolium medium]